MRVLLLTAHDIAEYDDLRMFTDMGVDVFSIGTYSDPRQNGPRQLRPALPDAPYHPDLIRMCEIQRAKHAGQSTDFGIVDWAKADLHPGIIDWADVIIVHHFVESWIQAQWERIRHKRVIWRTCGQSNPRLEHEMIGYHEQGLQIVRYSPAERRGFPYTFAGEDALIRFGKYPADYGPWIGDWPFVGNITQNMDTRGEHCGYPFWMEATKGLPVKPAGTGSERLPGGIGELSYPDMLDYLRHIRCYLYLGTQPASYTLGLMEAMLSGVPVISIPPDEMWMPALFEGHELALEAAENATDANLLLQYYLSGLGDPRRPTGMRQKAIDLFDVGIIGKQWADFLGITVPVEWLQRHGWKKYA